MKATKNGKPKKQKTMRKLQSDKSSRKPRGEKKESVASLKRKADKYFSLYIRLRDSDEFGVGDCITCGDKKHYKQMQCGHFVSRKTNALRYDEENCNLQCVGCNMFKAGEQYQYSKALDLKYGEGTADRLFAQRFDSHKFTREELEEVIHDSKEQCKFYENHNANYQREETHVS